MGWCYGGYHGDAVHVETAALDRNCRRACAEIYKGHQFRVKGGRVRGGVDGAPIGGLCVLGGCQERAFLEVSHAGLGELVFFMSPLPRIMCVRH